MSDFTNGTYKILNIKQNGVYLPIGCLTDNSFEETSEMLDTTTRDNANGWGTSRPVGQKYSISFSGLVTKDISSSSVVTFHEIRLLKRNRELVEWMIDDGTEKDFGKAYINSVSNTGAIDEFVSFSGGMVGYGEPSNQFDSIYFGYKDRVELAGGTITSEMCTKEYIETLI